MQEEHRARDLFYALWVPDLFMKRVENNEDWSLFCPNESPGLADCWGEKFEQLYTRYERQVYLGLDCKITNIQQGKIRHSICLNGLCLLLAISNQGPKWQPKWPMLSAGH